MFSVKDNALLALFVFNKLILVLLVSRERSLYKLNELNDRDNYHTESDSYSVLTQGNGRKSERTCKEGYLAYKRGCH